MFVIFALCNKSGQGGKGRGKKEFFQTGFGTLGRAGGLEFFLPPDGILSTVSKINTIIFPINPLDPLFSQSLPSPAEIISVYQFLNFLNFLIGWMQDQYPKLE